MKWEDTVLSGKRIYEIGEDCNWWQGTSGVPFFHEQALEQQAELSFKAGMKEVVEWINYYLDIPEIKDTYADKIIRPQLEAQLESWFEE